MLYSLVQLLRGIWGYTVAELHRAGIASIIVGVVMQFIYGLNGSFAAKKGVSSCLYSTYMYINRGES